MTQLRAILRATLSSCAALLLLACGGKATVSNGDGGAGGDGGSLNCSLPQPGAPFDFTITNVGTRDLRLTYACGKTMPISLDTADGPAGIGPGNASFCEVPCEVVYDGYENWGCSDCGPGVSDDLLPGQTVTINWDRRVYQPHEASPACSGHEDGNMCALGVPVDAAAVTSGTLSLCLDESFGLNGYCGEEELLPFAIDLSKTGLQINVQ